MPAIQPARLKKQVVELAGNFNQPALFVRQLHALLTYYTDHTHRQGQSGEPSPLLRSYKAPPPVMRQLWRELLPMTRDYPGCVLPLCDALWAEPNLDLQLLAARLLGEVPAGMTGHVVQRLRDWVNTGIDRRLLDGLLHMTMGHLQQEAPEQVMALIAAWLESDDFALQQAGLRALLPMIDSLGSEGLPAVFRLLTPYLRVAPSRLRPDVLAALVALAHFSPAETAFILRQNLSAPDNPDTAWLIRQVVDEFPDETRAGLKGALKEKR